MIEYRWNLVKYLKVKYYTWRAEHLVTKCEDMLSKMPSLLAKAKRYQVQADKLLKEMRW